MQYVYVLVRAANADVAKGVAVSEGDAGRVVVK